MIFNKTGKLFRNFYTYTSYFDLYKYFKLKFDGCIDTLIFWQKTIISHMTTVLHNTRQQFPTRHDNSFPQDNSLSQNKTTVSHKIRQQYFTSNINPNVTVPISKNSECIFLGMFRNYNSHPSCWPIIIRK